MPSKTVNITKELESIKSKAAFGFVTANKWIYKNTPITKIQKYKNIQYND